MHTGSTPPKPISEQFKRDVRELAATFEHLRLPLHEEGAARKLTDAHSTDPRTATPKAQVQHYVAHTLTGLETLHDMGYPNAVTAANILMLRDETTKAIRAVRTEFQFREGTLPRDLIDRLDTQLIGLYRQLEPMAKAVGPHSAAIAAEDRSGPRTK